MSAILFGSISTVADTSELQRQAFNQAFEQHGLHWRWDRDEYRGLLTDSGGRGRVAQYAAKRGQTVDAEAVHDTKSKIFQESLATAQLTPRLGVVDAIKGSQRSGWKVGLVTTTSPANVSALLAALAPELSADDFDVVVDASNVERPKPDPAAFSYALTKLGEASADCVAIEDNADGIRAAVAAGLACVAFPNANTAAHELPGATRRVDRLDVNELQLLTRAA